MAPGIPGRAPLADNDKTRLAGQSRDQQLGPVEDICEHTAGR